MTAGIYKIENIVDGKFYIGSSKDIEHRWIDHKSTLRKNLHNRRLNNAWFKYGSDNFKMTIIEQCEPIKEILLEREQYYLDLYKPFYNMNPLASSRLGSKESLESRLKRSGYVNAIDENGNYIKVTKEEYYSRNLTCNNTGKLPVVDKSGNKFLAPKDHPNVLSGEWSHVSKDRVTTYNKITGTFQNVPKEIYESDSNLVGVNSGRVKGQDNPNAKRIAIYDVSGNLIKICNGDFKSYCLENNLPFVNLRKSYSENGKPIFETQRQMTFAERRGYIQYKGWFAKLIAK
jgi:group I intron endonuclease